MKRGIDLQMVLNWKCSYSEVLNERVAVRGVTVGLACLSARLNHMRTRGNYSIMGDRHEMWEPLTLAEMANGTSFQLGI
jgi:hypothetical protein